MQLFITQQIILHVEKAFHSHRCHDETYNKKLPNRPFLHRSLLALIVMMQRVCL